MTVAVETERSGVRRALLELVDVMLDAGAWVNPDIRFVESQGQIGVWAQGVDPWLLRIPQETLVPVADLVWSDDPPLAIVESPGLTALQRQVLDACVEVMREAGTWEHFRATHPRATITDPQVIAMIQSLHPAFTPARGAGAMLRTRTIGLTSDGGTSRSHLMPLLDLVNNHPGAPAYTWDDEFLCIPVWQVEGGGECFVSYGSRRDVLGIALAYGYVDENITRVNTLSADYSLADGSRLHMRRSSHHRVSVEEAKLTLEGAAFDPCNASVKRTTFDIPVEKYLRERGMAPLQARHHVRVMWRRTQESDVERLVAARDFVVSRRGEELIRRALEGQIRNLVG